MLNTGTEILCFVSFSGLEFIDLYLLERLFDWREGSRSFELFRFVFDAKVHEISSNSSFLQTSIGINHMRLITSASKILILPKVLLNAIRNQQQATRKRRKHLLMKHKTHIEQHISVFLNIDNMSAIQYIGLKKLYDLMYKGKRCIKMIRRIFRDKVNANNVDVKIRSMMFQYARSGQQLLFLHSFLDSFLDADLQQDFLIFSEDEMPLFAEELLEYLPNDKDAHHKFLSILQAFVSNLAPVLRVNVHENTHNDTSFWKALLDRSIICDYRDKRETLHNKGSSIIEILRCMEDGNVANFDFWKTVLSVQQIMTPFQKIRVFDELYETREKTFEPNMKKESRPSCCPLPKIAAQYFEHKGLRSFSDTVLDFLKTHCFRSANTSTWLRSNCLHLVKILLMLKQSSINGIYKVTDKRKYCVRDFAIWNEMFNSFNSSFEPSTNVRARLQFHFVVKEKNEALKAEAKEKSKVSESNFQSIAPSNFDEYFKTQYELFATGISHTILKRVAELWLKTMNHPDLTNCLNDVEFADFFQRENLAHLRSGYNEGYEHWFFNFFDDEGEHVHISRVLFALAFGLGVLRVKNISNVLEHDSDAKVKKLIIWGNVSGRQDNAFYDPDYFLPLAWRLYNQYKDDFLVFHGRTVEEFHSFLRKGIGLRHAKCVITALQFLNFCIVRQKNPQDPDQDEIIEWIINDLSPIQIAGKEITAFVSLHLSEMRNCRYLKELKDCISRNLAKDSKDVPSFEQDLLNHLCREQNVRIIDGNEQLFWNETSVDRDARTLAIYLLFTNRKRLNSVCNRREFIEWLLSEGMIGESCNQIDWTPEGEIFLNSVIKVLERDLGALALKNEGVEYTWQLDCITSPQVTMFSDSFSSRISSCSRVSKAYMGLFLQDFRINKSIQRSNKLEEWFLSVDVTKVWSTQVKESPLDFASFFCYLNRKKYIEFSDVVEFRWNLHTLLEKFLSLKFYKQHVTNNNDKVTEKSKLLELISNYIKGEQEAHPNGFAHDPYVTKEQVLNKMVTGLKVLNTIAFADPTANLKWQNPKYFELQTAAFVAHNLPALISCRNFRELVEVAKTKEHDEVKCEFIARNVIKFLTERKMLRADRVFHWNTGLSSSYIDRSLFDVVQNKFVEIAWKQFHNWFDLKDFVKSSAFLNAVEPPLDIVQARKFLDCLLVFKGTQRELLQSEYFGGLMVMHHDDFGVNWDESILSIEQSAKSLFEQNKKELIACITRTQLNQVLKRHNLSADVSQYLKVWTLTNAPKENWSEFSIIEKNCGEERFKILRYVDSKFLMWFEPDLDHLQIAEDLYTNKNQDLLECRNELSLRRFIIDEIGSRERSKRCLADSSSSEVNGSSLETQQEDLQNMAAAITATRSPDLQYFFELCQGCDFTLLHQTQQRYPDFDFPLYFWMYYQDQDCTFYNHRTGNGCKTQRTGERCQYNHFCVICRSEKHGAFFQTPNGELKCPIHRELHRAASGCEIDLDLDDILQQVMRAPPQVRKLTEMDVRCDRVIEALKANIGDASARLYLHADEQTPKICVWHPGHFEFRFAVHRTVYEDEVLDFAKEYILGKRRGFVTTHPKGPHMNPRFRDHNFFLLRLVVENPEKTFVSTACKVLCDKYPENTNVQNKNYHRFVKRFPDAQPAKKSRSHASGATSLSDSSTKCRSSNTFALLASDEVPSSGSNGYVQELVQGSEAGGDIFDVLDDDTELQVSTASTDQDPLIVKIIKSYTQDMKQNDVAQGPQSSDQSAYSNGSLSHASNEQQHAESPSVPANVVAAVEVARSNRAHILAAIQQVINSNIRIVTAYPPH
jgi:hypothetical protein